MMKGGELKQEKNPEIFTITFSWLQITEATRRDNGKMLDIAWKFW